jgi:tellurite methyltransferase
VTDQTSQAIWRRSTWFDIHMPLIRSGMKVLDLACGIGRHAIAAALRGADVVAIDRDEEKLRLGREQSEKKGAVVTWVHDDLETMTMPTGFDLVMLFNYLDRRRFPSFVEAVRPGGFFIYEGFLEGQRGYGWGPTSPNHLLKPSELSRLIRPLELVYGREVLEVIDNRYAARASVLARRVQ